MTEEFEANEAVTAIEELDQAEATQVGGGLNFFDDLYAWLKRAANDLV